MDQQFKHWILRIQASASQPCSFYCYHKNSSQIILKNPLRGSTFRMGFFPGITEKDHCFTDQEIDFLLGMDHIITTDYFSQIQISVYVITSVIPPPIFVDTSSPLKLTFPNQAVLLYFEDDILPNGIGSLWQSLRKHLTNFPDTMFYIRCNPNDRKLLYLSCKLGLETHQYVYLDHNLLESDQWISDKFKAIIYPYNHIPSGNGKLFWLSQFRGIAWISHQCPLYKEFMQWGDSYCDIESIHDSLEKIFNSTYDYQESSTICAKSMSTYLTHPTNIEFAYQNIINDQKSKRLSIAIVCIPDTKITQLDPNILKIFQLSQKTYSLLHNYSFYDKLESLDKNHSYEFILHISPFTIITDNNFSLDKFIQTRLSFNPNIRRIQLGSCFIENTTSPSSDPIVLDIKHHRFFNSKSIHPDTPVHEWLQPGDFLCDFSNWIHYSSDIPMKAILDQHIYKIQGDQFKALIQSKRHNIGKSIQLDTQSYQLLPYSSVSQCETLFWSIDYGSILMLYDYDGIYPQETKLTQQDTMYFTQTKLFNQPPRSNPDRIIAVEVSNKDISKYLIFLRHICRFAEKNSYPFYFKIKEDIEPIPIDIKTKMYLVDQPGFFINKDCFPNILLDLFVEKVSHPFDSKYELLKSNRLDEQDGNTLIYLYHYLYTF